MNCISTIYILQITNQIEIVTQQSMMNFFEYRQTVPKLY